MTVGILLFLVAIIGTYIVTFKNDFKKEELEVAVPFIIILVILATLAAII